MSLFCSPNGMRACRSSSLIAPMARRRDTPTLTSWSKKTRRSASLPRLGMGLTDACPVPLRYQYTTQPVGGHLARGAWAGCVLSWITLRRAKPKRRPYAHRISGDAPSSLHPIKRREHGERRNGEEQCSICTYQRGNRTEQEPRIGSVLFPRGCPMGWLGTHPRSRHFTSSLQ
jgi:hypothetical protein